jgi:hypothetical protein
MSENDLDFLPLRAINVGADRKRSFDKPTAYMVGGGNGMAPARIEVLFAGGDAGEEGLIPSASAFRTRSARERADFFFIG